MIAAATVGCKRLLGRRSNGLGKIARASENGRDFDHSGAEPVDHAIRVHDDLSNCRILPLWNHSAGFWKELKPLDDSDDPPRDELCIHRRVLSNERANRLDVPNRLWRPDDWCHRPSRRFASSWGTPLPASSSASPASILARKTSRSIASSKVALDGKSSRACRIRSLTLGSGMTNSSAYRAYRLAVGRVDRPTLRVRLDEAIDNAQIRLIDRAKFRSRRPTCDGVERSIHSQPLPGGSSPSPHRYLSARPNLSIAFLRRESLWLRPAAMAAGSSQPLRVTAQGHEAIVMRVNQLSRRTDT